MSTLHYAITDRTQYAETEPERHAALVAQASRLATEGVDFIQLREKDIPAQNLIGVAREILNVIRQGSSGTRLLINSRADVAIAAGAHGVHLPSGREQLKPVQVRQIFLQAGQAGPTVSVSCHSMDDVMRAREDGADLILFGPVFGKSVTDKVVVPETGLAALKVACKMAGETAVLALGGITAGNAGPCLAAGAKGIAAIRLFR